MERLKLMDWEIVGVIGDILYQVGKEPKATIYFPILEGRMRRLQFTRQRIHCNSFESRCKNRFASLDPELPVSNVLTMKPSAGVPVNASLSATLVLAFAILSVDFASVGRYGRAIVPTTSDLELGIRMALGAQRDQPLQLMLRMVAASAVRAGPWFGDELRGDTHITFDAFRNEAPRSCGSQAWLQRCWRLVVPARLAPAWHASRLDPMKALRTE